jgi:hypothetical protein
VIHQHPNPTLDRLAQSLCLLILVALAVAEVGLIVFFASGHGAFLLMGMTLVLFAPYLLMQTTISPTVVVDDDGLTLRTLFWGEVRLAWDDARAFKTYPLLPPPDNEALRRVMVGRIKYQAAQGVMLVVPRLPWLYRFNGIFVGEGFIGVIAITNRTHTDYAALCQTLTARYGEAVVVQ